MITLFGEVGQINQRGGTIMGKLQPVKASCESLIQKESNHHWHIP